MDGYLNRMCILNSVVCLVCVIYILYYYVLRRGGGGFRR